MTVISLNEEKILLCCVCKQFMKDPQLLKCLHSCCKLCIMSDKQFQTLVNCPLCNEETSCEHVTENVFIATRICRLDFLRGNDKCRSCNKDAMYSCNSCCKLLCNECVYYHSVSGHAVLALDDIKSINELDGEQFCNIDERPYTYACRDCQKLKCDACVAKCSMEGHDTVLLDTGANDYALHVKEEVLCLKDTLKRVSKDFINKPTPTTLLKDAYRASSEKLSENKRRIDTALKRIFSEAKDELDFMYASLALKASERTEYAKSLNDKSSQAVEYCEQISTAKATYLLEQQATLVKRLEYLGDEMERMQTSYYMTDDIAVETSETASIDETIKLWIGSLKKVEVAQRNTEQISVYVGKNPSEDEGSNGVLAKTVLPLSHSLSFSSWKVSEKPDTTKLTPSVVEMKIRKIEEEEGVLLSYYFGPDYKFIVHIEDQKGNYIMNLDKIKEKVKTALGNCVAVVVIGATASCILTSVGADMSAFGLWHCMGMYLKGENAVYWLSVAHAYIAAKLKRLKFEEKNVNVSVFASGRRDSSDVIRIELPVPNLLLPQPPFGSTRAQVLFLTDGFPTLDQGKRLRHSLDIMGGKLHPDLLAQGTVGSELNCDLSSVYKKCPVCFSWFCNSPDHPVRGLLYNINGVSDFPTEVDDMGYYWYDCRRLLNNVVYCRPGGNESLAVGRVIVTDPINKFYVKFSNDSPIQYQMENILVIEPLGDVDPKQGHSGSVWVESPSGLDMAVAITIGVSENFSHEDRKSRTIQKTVWLAILLRPALEALHVASL